MTIPRFLLPIALLTLGSLSSVAITRVRTEVTTGGLYEISHDALREAGFLTPENVGIEGCDGPVGVMHLDGRMIAWLEGVESFSFRPDDSKLGGKFVNNGRYPYSDRMTYILTDDPGKRRVIQEIDGVSSYGSAREATYGVALLSHENDLLHNNTATGTIFWGEALNHGAPSRYDWNVDLKGKTGIPANLTANFYLFSKDIDGKLTAGLLPGDHATYEYATYKPTYLTPVSLTRDINVGERKTDIRVEFSSSAPYAGIVNLDYWTLSYPHDLRLFNEAETALANSSDILHSLFMALPEANGYTSIRFPVSNPNTVAFDITSPASPVLHRSVNGEITLEDITVGVPVVALCDLSSPLPQLTLTDPVTTDSDRLKEIAGEGADMLVISPGWLCGKAEELADIHREMDGMKVTTVDVRAIYDTFSAGNPDPDGVRRFIKGLREHSGRPLGNVLLLGPLATDTREVNPDSVIIAPQALNQHYERGAYTALPYYVGDEDNLSDEYLMKASISCGIGTLPVASLEEAELCIDKIRRHISSPHKHTQLGNMLWIGGEGDKHTHVSQTVALAEEVTEASKRGVIHSMLPIDTYGFDESRRRMFDLLDRGMAITTYIGHADPTMLGKWSNTFLTPADLLSLRNEQLTFLVTAGCSATHTDKGVRGIAEHMVVSVPYGAFGGLVTSRETWSGQNKTFLSRLFSMLYANPGCTIGEVYAKTLTSTRDTNEMAYILMCDPALKIPVPLLNIQPSLEGSLQPGNTATLTGRILNAYDDTYEGFSGMVTAHLLAPAITYECECVATGLPNQTSQKVELGDNILATATGEVENGVFTIELPVPESVAMYCGQSLNIHLSAYDSIMEKGAGSRLANVKLAAYEPEEGVSSDAKDVTAPSIENTYYDASANRLVTELSDDRILDLYGNTQMLTLTLDGGTLNGSKGTVDETGNDGRWCRISIPLPSLSEGEHYVTLEARDAAGNTSYAERVFTTGLPGVALQLSMEQTAVTTHADFMTSSIEDGTTDLIILTADDIQIRKINVDSENVRWDRDDNTGKEVASGRYKAYLRHESPDGTLSFSPYLPIIVL